jgi:hypothetical protein
LTGNLSLHNSRSSNRFEETLTAASYGAVQPDNSSLPARVKEDELIVVDALVREYWTAGDLERGVEAARRSVLLTHELHDESSELAIALANLGRFYVQDGQEEAAALLFEQAREMIQAHGPQRFRDHAWVEECIGDFESARGNKALARQALLKSIELELNSLELQPIKSEQYIQINMLVQRISDLIDVSDAADSAAEIDNKISTFFAVAAEQGNLFLANYHLGSMYMDKGQADTAAYYLDQSLTYWSSEQQKPDLAVIDALTRLGILQEKQNLYKEASAKFLWAAHFAPQVQQDTRELEQRLQTHAQLASKEADKVVPFSALYSSSASLRET